LTAEAANLIQQSRYAQALECYNLLKQCDSQINTAADENQINERWGDALFSRRFYTEAIRNIRRRSLRRKCKKPRPKSKWLGIELVFVPGGSFQMGDVFGDGESDERPVHTVQLSRFYLSKYEITFEQYDTFCKERASSWRATTAGAGQSSGDQHDLV
jgi:formylglycine-generating enzyme required for sulfatase activity